jgi:carboxymethylenebutenolidase
MSGKEVTIAAATGGGSFTGYLAKPSLAKGQATAPGIVLIQEIFGVNRDMRNLADNLAKAGYVALCPDLFWRQEPGIQLTDQSDAEWAKAFELFQGFDLDLGVADLAATLAHLRKLPGCSGRAGAVGYCLGGRLAYLMASRTDCDASVGYYGVYLQEHLAEAKNIKKPLMLHVAEEDEFVPKEAQAQIFQGLRDHPKVTVHRYPGLNHAFARVGGKHYDKANADLANRRTLDFFNAHLR